MSDSYGLRVSTVYPFGLEQWGFSEDSCSPHRSLWPVPPSAAPPPSPLSTSPFAQCNPSCSSLSLGGGSHLTSAPALSPSNTATMFPKASLENWFKPDLIPKWKQYVPLQQIHLFLGTFALKSSFYKERVRINSCTQCNSSVFNIVIK